MSGARLSPAWVAAGTGLALAGLAASSFGLAWLSTHPPRVPLWRTPDQDGLPYECVEFPSRDGIPLSGWFIPSPESLGAVVLCHGFPMNRCEMLFWAAPLHAAGFDLLLFDFRALGRSGGDRCTIGAEEVQDLLGALDHLESRADCAGPIGVFGLSMGGAVALQVAARDQRIAAVATHGAYATLDSAIDQRGRFYLGPFGPALSGPARLIGRRWLGRDPRTVAPVREIGAIAPRPVLLLHGTRDRTVSVADAHALYRAAGEPRELRLVPGGLHVFVPRRARAATLDTVCAFFRRALASRAAR